MSNQEILIVKQAPPSSDLEEVARSFARADQFGPDAIQANIELLRHEPGNIDAMNRIARCHVNSGARNSARHFFERVLQVDPNNRIATNGIADLDSPTDRLTIRRHSEFLESRSLVNRGVRIPTSHRRRVTHCWLCKRGLDNLIDVECVACGWIVCRCGACGCANR